MLGRQFYLVSPEIAADGVCLDAGINLFDTADIYSNGLSEEILGNAVAGKRQDLLISTKTTFRLGDGPNDVGSSR